MSRSDVNVRVLLDGEYDAIRSLEVAAFGDESIGVLLDALHASWAWVPELSLVAEHGGEVCGHVQLSRAILDAPDRLRDVLVLSPVGVRPDLQRKGIGTAMISQALAIVAATRPEPAVFLEGSWDFYPRFGFERAGAIGFRRPSLRIPERGFQVLRLPTYEASLGGTVVYPDAFWRTDSVGLR
jgi:putative acetyltransferase